MQSPPQLVSSLSSLIRSNARYTRHLEPDRVLLCTCSGKRLISSPSLSHYHTTQRSPEEHREGIDGAKSIISLKRRPTATCTTSAMPQGNKASSLAATAGKKEKKLAEPRPSSSIILLSPTNQVLLLHRVKTSTSFASAHVFPGGNLSDFHDGAVPPHGDPKRHEDSLAYRMGAIRETFEESGILLAREGSKDGRLLNLPTAKRDEARKAIWENKISFGEWLESVGGIPDIGE